MDTAQQPANSGPPDAERYVEVHTGDEFRELRRSYRSFAFPLTVGFIAWYMLYVLLSNYAGGFMDTKVVGYINVAFVLGLLQFVTTFLIAWWYSRFATAKLDRRADALRAELENSPRAGAAVPAAAPDLDKGTDGATDNTDRTEGEG